MKQLLLFFAIALVSCNNSNFEDLEQLQDVNRPREDKLAVHVDTSLHKPTIIQSIGMMGEIESEQWKKENW